MNRLRGGLITKRSPSLGILLASARHRPRVPEWPTLLIKLEMYPIAKNSPRPGICGCQIMLSPLRKLVVQSWLYDISKTLLLRLNTETSAKGRYICFAIHN